MSREVGEAGAQQQWGGRSIGLQQGAMEPDEGLTGGLGCWALT